MSVTSDLIPAERPPILAERAARRERWHLRVNRSAGFFELLGLGWLIPLVRMALGDDLRQQGIELSRQLCVPLIAIILFLGVWAWLAPKVQTSLGALPGPVQVWQQ